MRKNYNETVEKMIEVLGMTRKAAKARFYYCQKMGIDVWESEATKKARRDELRQKRTLKAIETDPTTYFKKSDSGKWVVAQVQEAAAFVKDK